MSKQPTTAELRQRIEISRVGSEVKQCAIEVCSRLEAAEAIMKQLMSACINARIYGTGDIAASKIQALLKEQS